MRIGRAPRIAVLFIIALVMMLLCSNGRAQERPRSQTAAAGLRTLTVVTEPNAIVWVDEIRRGTTDQSGRLTPVKISSGQHTLHVRAYGFKEASAPISPTQRGEIKVRLVATVDEAELTFQQAETARDLAKDEASRQRAEALYRQALKLRPALAAAHVGLARVLMDLNDTAGALSEIDIARRIRPDYPEASAVEGRIYREAAQTDEAIGSFNRAIREGHGFQPEAHVGLGRVYEERGQYDLAAREYQIGINQLSDTEPVIYQLLGAAYEKTGQTKEAVAAYENYLRLAPNGSQATAVRSIIDQLRAQPPN
jgi:tetratricopeptide (TPR) repeat protein